MIVQGSGAILNIILDPVFIFGLDMGVVGAAAATVIGQISGACIGFFLLWRIRGEFSVSFRGFRPDRALSAELLRIAAPAVVMQSLSSFMSLGLNPVSYTHLRSLGKCETWGTACSPSPACPRRPIRPEPHWLRME